MFLKAYGAAMAVFRDFLRTKPDFENALCLVAAPRYTRPLDEFVRKNPLALGPVNPTRSHGELVLPEPLHPPVEKDVVDAVREEVERSLGILDSECQKEDRRATGAERAAVRQSLLLQYRDVNTGDAVKARVLAQLISRLKANRGSTSRAVASLTKQTDDRVAVMQRNRGIILESIEANIKSLKSTTPKPLDFSIRLEKFKAQKAVALHFARPEAALQQAQSSVQRVILTGTTAEKAACSRTLSSFRRNAPREHVPLPMMSVGERFR